MRLHFLSLAAFCGLLLCAAPQAGAAGKTGKASKSEDYRLIPAMKWDLIATGFIEVFQTRNREIESSEIGRFFPGTVAFVLRAIDDTGHYLMLNCGSSAACGSRRDALEDRMVFATLLDSVRTPRVRKDQLYNPLTWELSPLGEKYVDILRKRYPDLPARLGKLINGAFVRQN